MKFKRNRKMKIMLKLVTVQIGKFEKRKETHNSKKWLMKPFG